MGIGIVDGSIFDISHGDCSCYLFKLING
jgi:hypothetical protein